MSPLLRLRDQDGNYAETETGIKINSLYLKKTQTNQT